MQVGRRPSKAKAKVRKRRLPAGARERAPIVVERLKLEYGEAHTELDFGSPWQLLVSVILSAQTTDVNVNSVTPALFARYPTVADLAAAEQARRRTDHSQDGVLPVQGARGSRDEPGPGAASRRRGAIADGGSGAAPRGGTQDRQRGARCRVRCAGICCGHARDAAHAKAPAHVRNRPGEDRGRRVQHRPAERMDRSEPSSHPARSTHLHREQATLPRVCARRHLSVGGTRSLEAPGRPATSSGEGSLNSGGMLWGRIVSQSIHGEVATPPQPRTMLASQ